MKKHLFLTGLALILAVGLLNGKAGKHVGENKQLDVDIQFSQAKGVTVTDGSGTYFKYYGYTFKEDKVYPPEYWGEYPLYFFGNTVGVTVTVTNTGPRAKIKLQVKCESYVLLTDGTAGECIKEPQTVEFVVEKGETKTIDASFKANATPTSISGLDIFVVKLLHPNQGGGPGNEEPALISQKVGVFCPPAP